MDYWEFVMARTGSVASTYRGIVGSIYMPREPRQALVESMRARAVDGGILHHPTCCSI